MDTIVVRVARQVDTLAMGRVMVETYLRSHRGQIPEEAWQKRKEEWTAEVSAEAWARTLQAIAEEVEPKDCVFVAVEILEEGERVVGVAMGGEGEDGYFENAGEVYALYVSFDCQKRGVGRRLVGAVAAHLAERGMTALIIGCLNTNEPAAGFYAALGGQVIGERAVEESGYPVTLDLFGWADSSCLYLLIDV